MKALSVILIGLTLVFFLFIVSFSQTVNSQPFQHSSILGVTVGPGTGIPLFSDNFLPIANHNFIYPTSTITKTPTVTRTITVTPSRTPFLSDLVAAGVGVVYRDECPWGSPGILSGTVLNQGKGKAGEFSVYLEVEDHPYLIKGMLAGSATQVSREFTHGPVGHLYLRVDIYDQILETDEENNLFYILYTPPPYCDTATPKP